MLELRQHQKDAVANLDNGKILYGQVGTGKTRTAVAYYEQNESPKDVYVITTAKKRDSLDWERDFAMITCGKDITIHGKLTVDSWNNVTKYRDVEKAFFIFDEQRLVGHGVWVKAFQKIVANGNRWILLSGTPGDTWMDYAAVFIANGYYKNITQFRKEHVLMEPYSKFPKIAGYLNEYKLNDLRNTLLVEMPFEKHTIRHLNHWDVSYDKELFNKVIKKRWNIFEDAPIKDAAELGRVMRKLVNSDPSRMDEIRSLMKIHPKLIIFYNFNYELEALRELSKEVPMGEWNGHKKQPIPQADSWVYLVQYTSGAEGWNCTETNSIVFYSLTYSWRVFEQCQGRIDRLDTPFTDLFYYVLMTHSAIDLGIMKRLEEKEDFNERKFVQELVRKVDVSKLLEADSIQELADMADL